MRPAVSCDVQIDGLWGKLIVHDPSKPRFEVDTVLAVNDW
jgi:hypothetical protein